MAEETEAPKKTLKNLQQHFDIPGVLKDAPPGYYRPLSTGEMLAMKKADPDGLAELVAICPEV